MKINVFPSNSRGIAEHGWLHSRFSYSFAEYFDRNRLQFGALRVLNDDVVDPGMGFGMHPHDNMEIITIPLSGSLEHKDSMGNGSIIIAGDVQVMSAGTGIMHSEFNPSNKEPVSLFQIWILPNKRNITPRYDQRTFDPCDFFQKFHMVVGPEGTENVLTINQNAYLHIGQFPQDTKTTYQLKKSENGLFVIVIKGEVDLEGYMLSMRDAAEISETDEVRLKFKTQSEVLLIEVPLK